MIRSIAGFIGALILIAAVYKIFGGDLGLAVSTAATFVIDIADAGSDVILEAISRLGG